MFKFNVSAPGRVFLYGDPVRYKELCTAASLNMRTKLTFSSMLPPGHPYFIDINFSSIKLHVKILLGAFYMHFSNKHIYSVLSDTELHGMVRNFVGSLKEYVGTYEPDNRAHRLSLEAFFFLLLRIAYERNVKITTSFKVEVSTELAIGEGLGSSASFATCLAACFYRWALLQQGVAVYIFNDEHLIDISKYVQSCDCTIYNSPTVIDSMICVYGSVQTFEKEVLLNMYCDMPNIKILLVFSNVSQKTTVEQGEHVERTLRSYPFVESIQKNIDNVVQRSRKIFGGIEKKLRRSSEIHNISCDSEEDLFHLVPTISGVKLKALLQMNQGLLCALGMSHPNLDIICAIAQSFSLAGKLSCNGGGGHAIILLLPDSTDVIVNQLLDEFKSHSFPVKATNLNCNGVRVE